jgi:hypothetical protein
VATELKDYHRNLALRLMNCVRILCVSDAVTDTIWCGTGRTLCEEIADIAGELGATDDEIEKAFCQPERDAAPGYCSEVKQIPYVALVGPQ